MASIILSFVGNQDPYSDNTSTEGSIITLVRHLLHQQCQIARVILLYTTTTQQRASDTQAWLESELHLSETMIALNEVDSALSHDPVELLLAVEAARQGLEQALPHQEATDYLELNASSGTPVMKSAWSILQAAGYMPNSRVWQVRNPDKIQPGQMHVFQTNVDRLKWEFDLKIVQQQVADYNYNGALVTLTAAKLENSTTKALLEYGRCRKAFDFNAAFSVLDPIQDDLKAELVKEMAFLRSGDSAALAKECYFIALTKLKNREYAEFLVLLASFQESALRSLLRKKLDVDLRTGSQRNSDKIWREIRAVDEGKLMQYLEAYKLSRGQSLVTQGFINTTVMTAILEYYRPSFADVEPHLEGLKKYIKDRNNQVHRLEGVSKIDNEGKVLSHLKQILKRVISVPSENPFDHLNQEIFRVLSI